MDARTQVPTRTERLSRLLPGAESPAFEALAQTEWQQWAKTLYAPLLEWMQQISVISLADGGATDAASGEGAA